MKVKVPNWFWGFVFAIKAQPKYVTLSLGFAFLVSSLPSLNVRVIGFLARSLDENASLFVPLVFLVLLFGTSTILNNLEQQFHDLVYFKVQNTAHQNYNQVLARIPARHYGSEEFMSLTRNARQAITQMKIWNQYTAIKHMLAAIVGSIMLCTSLWEYNHIVALLSIIVPFPMMISNIFAARYITKYWPIAIKGYRRGHYFQNQLSYRRSAIDLASVNGTGLIAQESNKNRAIFVKYNFMLDFIVCGTNLIAGIFAAIVFAVCLYIMAAESKIENIIAGISGLTASIAMLARVGYQFGRLNSSIFPTQQYRELMSYQADSSASIDLAQINEISFEDVTVNYGNHQAVKSISLKLKHGGFAALVGENGSGKTSFFKAIMGTQREVSGRIKIDGKSFALEDQNLFIPFVAVLQDYGRYEITLRQFLSLGLGYEPTDKQLWDAIDMVELSDVCKNYKFGLDTLLGSQWDDGVDLSGGQWQRLAIARAYLSDKQVIYLDEPTSAIDAPTEERIFHRFNEISNDKFILLTTHRVSTLKEARIIYVMEHGKIVESGTYSELNRPGTCFKKMFESQLL